METRFHFYVLVIVDIGLIDIFNPVVSQYLLLVSTKTFSKFKRKPDVNKCVHVKFRLSGGINVKQTQGSRV